MRKLATIQKILDIQPIPEADLIEVATILGWKVVVRKGDFKVGDLVVYCEIDSLLPDKPEFEFLRKNKFRIRTIKLKDQISQGIAFPLSIIKNNKFSEQDIGLDVTNLMGITKYEAPIPAELEGEVKGEIPSCIIKTDEDRIQILPHIIEQFGGQTFIETEKLDGASTTYYWKDGEFGVCGRNWEYFEDDKNSMWKFARKMNIEERLRSIGRNLALQGEVIGEGIQKNRYKLKGQQVRIFRIFDIDKYEFLTYEEMLEVLDLIGLESVPILSWDYVLPSTMEEVIERGRGKSVLNPDTEREGVVFVRYYDRHQGRLSFKSISNKFLLDNKE